MSGTTTHNEVRKALKRAVFNYAVGYPFAKQKEGVF